MIACSEGGDQAAKPEPRTFTLAGRAMTIDAPPGAALIVGDRSVRIDIRPGVRTPHTIDITLSPDGGDAAPVATALGAHADYSYRTAVTPGGSGGEETLLEGVWTVGGRRYGVTCRGQREAATLDDAAWCLPMMRSFREAPAATE